MSVQSDRGDAPASVLRPGDREGVAILCMVALLSLLALIAVASVAYGPSGTSLWQAVAKTLTGQDLEVRERVILFDIRLPRTVMGMMVGAALAVSGAVMQGLFRNPLADPGLVGVSAGAGLGAGLAIVLGGALPAAVLAFTGFYLVAFAAFFGGWVTTILLYAIATHRGKTSVAMMLLGGIALGALAGAVNGLLVYIADDQQLRDLQFWGLGSLAGANWPKVFAAMPLILAALAAAPFLARALNALALGEAAAAHLGIEVQMMKAIAILTVAGAVGASVAVAGGIGFVGIVVPHLLRLITGPDHRFLLINSALLGASFLLLADIISRLIVAPSEMPIGIITAAIGGPFFLWILLRNRSLLDL
ncbi:MAG: iron ABC transporter permease [Pseudomonadota bacterium]